MAPAGAILFSMASKLPPKQTEGLWLIDAEGKTVFANDSMVEILGTTAAQISRQDSFVYVYPEDMNAARRLFSLKEGGSSAPFHFRLRRADGSSIWVDVQGTPMHNAAGKFTGVVGTFTVSDKQDA